MSQGIFKEVFILSFCIILYIFICSILNIGCPILYFTGIPCPGCGMTRACIELLHLHFIEAFYFHPLIYFVPPYCVLYFYLKNKGHNSNILLYIFAVVFIATYLIRTLFSNNPVISINIKDGLIYRLLSNILERRY